MADIHLFQDLFTSIDNSMVTYVNGMSATLIGAITPVITVALTLWFLVYAAGIATGRVEMPISDFLWKSFKIAGVIGIALSAGYYQAEISTLITKTPDSLASTLVAADKSNEGNAQANVIDNGASKGFAVASDAFNKAGIFKEGGISYAFFGLIITAATCVLVAVGGALLVSAKVALAILAGLGPLFIAMLLFDVTKRFFEAWVGQVLTYALLLVLVAATFDFLLALFTTLMANITFDSNSAAAANVGEAFILGLVTLLVLIQLPGIAASLAGGIALNMSGAVATYKSGASGSASAARSSAGAASAIGTGAASAGRSAISAGGRAGQAVSGYFKGRK